MMLKHICSLVAFFMMPLCVGAQNAKHFKYQGEINTSYSFCIDEELNRDCRLMFSIRPKQPTDPIHFCVRVTKFPFYISFRSFRPDYLSIFNGRGVVPP